MQDTNTSSSNGQALIGQPMNRIDGRLKVTGRATYAAEHQIPNAAYAVMITSSIPNAITTM